MGDEQRTAEELAREHARPLVAALGLRPGERVRVVVDGVVVTVLSPGPRSRLTPCEADILRTLAELHPRRMVGEALHADMDRRGRIHGLTTAKLALARLRRERLIVNELVTARGQGYGLTAAGLEMARTLPPVFTLPRDSTEDPVMNWKKTDAPTADLGIDVEAMRDAALSPDPGAAGLIDMTAAAKLVRGRSGKHVSLEVMRRYANPKRGRTFVIDGKPVRLVLPTVAGMHGRYTTAAWLDAWKRKYAELADRARDGSA